MPSTITHKMLTTTTHARQVDASTLPTAHPEDVVSSSSTGDGSVANADGAETSTAGVVTGCATAQTHFAITSAAALASRTPKNDERS